MSLFAIPLGVVLLVVLVSAAIVPAGAQTSGENQALGAVDTKPDPSPPGGINFLETLEGSRSPEHLRHAINELTRTWSALSEKLPSASDSMLVVRTWRDEVERATNCLNTAIARSPASDEDPETVDLRAALEPCVEASRIADGLAPVIEAIARGENSALLVITSVACECVLVACARMSTLYDSLLTSEPQSPLARFDDMALPSLAEGWDLYEAPAWVFLKPAGNPSFLLEGNVESSVVLSEIEDWTKRASEKRGPGEHE